MCKGPDILTAKFFFVLRGEKKFNKTKQLFTVSDHPDAAESGIYMNV